ncbi:hypothetical protein [Scytonema millei]|uniref:hypothetical protein n=1 Tax=Scytonema millei TaxID=1245922 RepID=UPI002573AE0E|nr:hypothetical protein [Scytonema millei]
MTILPAVPHFSVAIEATRPVRIINILAPLPAPIRTFLCDRLYPDSCRSRCLRHAIETLLLVECPLPCA